MTRTLAILLLSSAASLAHDASDADAAFYQSLTQPNGTSCCSSSGPSRDCAPTNDWRTAGGGYEVMIDGRWLSVPADRVIVRHDAPGGQAILCAIGATIYCFVPGTLS